MFKARKMRHIVEGHLEEVNILLEHARKNNLEDSMRNYMYQKMALEHILRDFERIRA